MLRIIIGLVLLLVLTLAAIYLLDRRDPQ